MSILTFRVEPTASRPGLAAAEVTGRRHGFSVVELIIAVSIAALIAAVIIPMFLDSLDKAKQKRSMADINAVGKAMMAWLTDQAAASAAGQVTVDLKQYPVIKTDDLVTLLVPTYIQAAPEFDGWGSAYDYRLELFNITSRNLAAIRSPGKDGQFSGDIYTFESLSGRVYFPDLVWVDGFFVSWPEGK